MSSIDFALFSSRIDSFLKTVHPIYAEELATLVCTKVLELSKA
jgi:hypothetical protein